MDADRHGLFRPLEPPPGGAERFRQRLDAGGARGLALQWRVALAASAALVLVVPAILLFVHREPARDARRPSTSAAAIYDAPQFDRLLGRPVERSEPLVTINEQAATLAEVRSENAKVRIYTIH